MGGTMADRVINSLASMRAQPGPPVMPPLKAAIPEIIVTMPEEERETSNDPEDEEPYDRDGQNNPGANTQVPIPDHEDEPEDDE